MSDLIVSPNLIVFDLDYTIWPFDCGKDVVRPFSRDLDGNITDFYGRNANPYPDVSNILGAIVDANINIAFASRNSDQKSIENLLRLIPINCYKKPYKTLWDALIIPSIYLHAYSNRNYGGARGIGKDKHFTTIRQYTLIDYKRMIFFDDLIENIIDAREKGITSMLVGKEGLTTHNFIDAVNEWKNREIPAITIDDIAIASLSMSYIPIKK
jgi:magnesium-dependent phosphatase 1